MLTNLLVWLLVAALAALFVWHAIRAWRSGRPAARWIAAPFSALGGLLFLAIFALGGMGLYKLYVPVNRPVPDIQVNATADMIARGEHYALAFCAPCHSPDGQLPLIGGVNLSDDVSIPIGPMISVNLTPAGPVKDYSDGELIRLLREGIGRDGLPRTSMSAVYFRYMSDDDLAALIAYMRNTLPVEHETPLPADQPNFLGVLVTGAGIVPPLPLVEGPITAPAKAASAEYGEYLLSFQDCRVCHGPDLLGGKSALTPNGPSLLSVRYMSEEQFTVMLRTGKRPDGQTLQPPMPWQSIGHMDDTELSAIYRYLNTSLGTQLAEAGAE